MEYVSRRDFIKSLIVTGSATALATSPWLEAFGSDQPVGKGANDAVRLAVIGTGSRGSELLRHLLALRTECNISIAALCDNYEPNLINAAARCSAQGISPTTCSDFRRLIATEQLDGVIVATPLHQHAHITIECLDAGLHVFCEKAMARTLEDTKRMYDAHVSAKRILQIGQQRLFNPVYIEGMQRIHDGQLGVIGQIRAYWHRNNNWRRAVPADRPDLERKINWRLYQESSAGLLTELMSHQLQVANWALQRTPVSVMGTGSIRFWKDGREVDDNIALIYSYEDGTQFIYDSMISNANYGLEEQIMGHLGTIEFEVNRYYEESPRPAPGIQQLLGDIENGIFKTIPIGGSSWIAETRSRYKGHPILDSDDFSDSQLQLEGFAKYIRDGSAPEKLTQEGYNASAWTLLGEEAIRSGKKVPMPTEFILT